jgi:hypothetical protein
MNDIYSRLDRYGVEYDGVQVDQTYHEQVSSDSLTLGEISARGGKISRVRLIGGDYIPGRGKCYDVSYVHATLPDETIVQVNLQGLDNWNLLPRREVKGEFIAWAKNEHVFAKALGLLDESNYSWLG